MLAPLAVAAAAFGIYWAFFQQQRLDQPFRVYGTDAVNRQPAGEGGFLIAFAILGTLCTAGCATFLRRVLGARLERALEWAAARRRRVVLVLAAAASLAAAGLGALAFWHQSFTDDESAYLLTTKLLRHGHLTMPLHWPLDAFRYQFVVARNLRQFSIYGVAHPALLLPGTLIGLPQLACHLAVGVIVVATAGLARELYGERAAVLAALAAAASPFLLATGATLHNATTATAFCALFLWLWVRYEQRLHPGDAFGAGLALAVALHIRALDALAFAGPAALYALYRLFAAPHRRARLFGYAGLGSCVFFGLATYALVNAELTGNWLRTPYDLFIERWPGAKLFGFGTGPFKYFRNPPEVAFSKLCVQATRGSFWMLGWPLGVLPALAAPGRRALLLAAIPIVLLGGYFFYFANSVYDTGPVYYLCLLPVTAVLAVRGLGALRGPFGGSAPVAALLGLLAAGALFFAPREFLAAREVARSIRRPKLAVEQARLRHAFVLHPGVQPPNLHESWVFSPPIPGHPLDDENVVWVADVPARLQKLMTTYRGWHFFRLRWQAGQPVIEPADREP
ncbi:MAG TPA: glycosyltransferase family 39 protein [Polyangia bacterium]|nr:glycosyltransferase family 39 protein [Polyangia bacterium]